MNNFYTYLFLTLSILISGFSNLEASEQDNFIFNGFKELSSSSLSVEQLEEWTLKQFRLPVGYGLIEENRITDQLGQEHITYSLSHNGLPILGSYLIAHLENGIVKSVNGKLFSVDPQSPVLPETWALHSALNYVGANTYKWDIPEEEELKKIHENDPMATWYPRGELMYMVRDGDYTDPEFYLCWRFDIYAHDPHHRSWVFVDAQSGRIIFEQDRICSANQTATAHTNYSGVQTIITDNYTAGMYRLRETGRGAGIAIETYDMNNGTNYGSAVDFTHNSTTWGLTIQTIDRFALDAHYGSELTYDYFYIEHGRNSFDNAGTAIRSYIHYGNNYNNAFWDGSRMTYGDGDSSTFYPLTALDVVGHEIAHGVTQNAANLVYQNEPGALNESFSDIFGAAIEIYHDSASADWWIGEDMTPSGNGIRSMSNPNFHNHPDTYNGLHWYVGTLDNGGVHWNSGVQNFWFYLLVEGGSGTNDLGNSYTVNAIGINKAAAIAYRNLTVYLGVSSQYSDARYGAIQSAVDLYGPCSPELEAVTNAWYAVGVGNAYVADVIADFDADVDTACSAPRTVNFTNASFNANAFYWEFGDGDTSTQQDPDHTYLNFGNYQVTLIADGGLCGMDTIVVPNTVVIDSNLPCSYVMRAGQTDTAFDCQGTLFDIGGPFGNYPDQTSSSFTISPPGAATVTIDFLSFDVEPGSGASCNYDYVEIFDGPSTASPSLGRFCNTTGSPGQITSSGPSITIRLYTDLAANNPGFEMDWQCNYPVPPVANFSSEVVSNCAREVQFTDLSTELPNSWLWDFGDGNTSMDQNPRHQYAADGVYDVQLIVQNIFGPDTLFVSSAVTVQGPQAPVALGDTICDGDSTTLSATGSGNLYWYDSMIGGNILAYGPNFNTGPLNANTTFYVEQTIADSVVFGGPQDPSFGSGGYFPDDNRFNFFDVFAECHLVSVYVDAQAAGNRTIELRNSGGVVLDSRTVNLVAGPQRVNLGFDLTPGTDYELALNGTANLYRNNGGVSYPYLIDSLVSITRSNAGIPSAFYYFFYDWELVDSCLSPRTAVDVTVNTPSTYYADLDGDAFGDPNDSVISCTPVPGYVSNNGDLCPSDALKTAPGTCGCGVADIDTDNDGVLDCNDACPTDSLKWASTGTCGCGNPEPGTSCDDGLASTINDTITPSCGCAGVNVSGLVWNGSVDSDWHNPANWTPPVVPINGCAELDVIIPGGQSVYPIISDTISLHNLQIDHANGLTGMPGAMIQVCGDLTIGNSANWQFGSDAILRSIGTVGNQLWSGDMDVDLVVHEATVPVQILSGSNLIVRDYVCLIGSGSFVAMAGANVVLSSTPSGTAYLDDFSFPGNGGYVGEITAERGVFSSNRTFHFISSPVNGATVSGLTDDFPLQPLNGAVNGSQVVPGPGCDRNNLAPGSPYANLFEHIESAVTNCDFSAWHTKLAGSLSLGEGYAALLPANTTMDLTGAPGTGTIPFGPLTKTATNVSFVQGLNQLGNPYPSPMSWNDFVAANPDIAGTGYIWVSSGYYGGTFQPLSVLLPNTEIAMFQGFQVVWAGPVTATGTVNFNNSMRRGSDPAYLRNGQLYEHRIDLIAEGNGHADKTYLFYVDDATNAFDMAYDGLKMESDAGQPTLYTDIGGAKASINAKPELTPGERIPVGFIAGTSGSYSISAEQLETLPQGTLTYLIDNQAGNWHLLNAGPYQFTASTQDAPNRFELTFSPELDIDVQKADCDGNAGSVLVSADAFQVHGSSFAWDRIELLDDQGQLLQWQTSFVGQKNFTGLQTGSYVIQMTEAGYSFIIPVMVEESQEVVADFSADYWIVEVNEPLRFIDLSTGASSWTWDFGDGTQVMDIDEPVYSYVSPGVYTVSMDANNEDCADRMEKDVTVTAKATGIESPNSQLPVVFSDGHHLMVRFQDAKGSYQLKLYNLLGAQILNKQVEHDVAIPMDIAQGMYLVELSNAHSKVTKQVFFE